MKKRLLPIALALCIIFLFLGICILAASPEFSEINNSSTIFTDINKDPDMLVFVSPRYSGDEEIKASINRYATAVNADIFWNTKIIPLTQEQNNYKTIDEIIEDYYEKYERDTRKSTQNLEVLFTCLILRIKLPLLLAILVHTKPKKINFTWA